MPEKLSSVYKKFSDTTTIKNGFINLGCLLQGNSEEGLLNFCQSREIQQSDDQSLGGIIESILKHYQPKFNLLGYDLIKDKKFSDNVKRFDFISKTELMNVFADYCADININVFQTPEDNEYSVDLYLTKKNTYLKTETVFVLTGYEIEKKYKEIFLDIGRAGEISDWIIFVTTAAGVLKIGYDRLVADMQRVNAWLYVVDPHQKRIFGITKGGKSKTKNENLQNEYIRSLPPQPIRALSQVVKISKYAFSERDSYKPKKMSQFYVPSDIHCETNLNSSIQEKSPEIFRSLLIITKESGLSLFSFNNPTFELDEIIVSGFISAMDSFVGELSGSGDGGSSLKEIDYKNFKINGAIGEKVKIVVITSESVDEIFRERLDFYLNKIETDFQQEIDAFIKTGNLGSIDTKIFKELAQEILLI